MNTSTATTSTAAGTTLAAPLVEDRPAYRYEGDGRWLPANEAAHEECRLWNAYAAMITARSAAARSLSHDH